MNKFKRKGGSGSKVISGVKLSAKSAVQNYKALIYPMTAVKFFALVLTAGIFIVSADGWRRTFQGFLFPDSYLLASFASSFTFISVQLLEILPLMMSVGHTSCKDLIARSNEAQYDPFVLEYLREQDVIEEYRISENQLKYSMIIQAIAFAVDLVVCWISWDSPVRGFTTFLASGSIGALAFDVFGLTMVVLTVWGIPYVLRMAMSEAHRAAYLITKQEEV